MMPQTNTATATTPQRLTWEETLTALQQATLQHHRNLESRFAALVPKLERLASGSSWDEIPTELQPTVLDALEKALVLVPDPYWPR